MRFVVRHAQKPYAAVRRSSRRSPQARPPCRAERDNRGVPLRAGDNCPGFMAEPGRCWRMVYDHNLQATHCIERPSWTGRWFSPKGDRWWRVGACPDHLEGLTGLREFGRRH
jgi:hypothetical protein